MERTLRAMDDLKQSVQTAYLEQKDPLVIYKMEAYQPVQEYEWGSEQGYCFIPLSFFHSHPAGTAGRQAGMPCSKKAASKKPI